MIIKKTKGIEHKEFKETEMGMIPKEWEAVTLKEICEMERGFSYKSEHLTQEKTEKEFITINNLEKEGGLKDTVRLYLKDIVKGDERFYVGKNELFIANTDMAKGHIIGAPILIKDKSKRCVFSMDLTRLLLKSNDLTTNFFFYLLLHPKIRNFMKRNAQGTNVLHLNHQLIASLIFPLPPLSEQKKITEILLTVDQAIEKVNEAITKTEKLKKGLVQELLTKGIEHKEFKNTEIGKIPKDWHMTKLGNIIKQKKETISPCSIKPTRYIGLEHINSGECKIKQWGNSSEVKSIKFQFKAGDILYGKLRPYLNKVVIVEWNGVCSTDILVFEAKKIMINIYILYLMHHPNTLRYAIATSTGTNHPRTSWRMLSKLKVSLPPLPEQNKIAEILSTVDERIQLLKEKKNKLERVKKGLMNSLLTGRKRVKVEA